MTLFFRGALVALLFFSTSSLFASALDHEWLSLLRYNAYGNSFLSEADSDRFFLSNDGRSNPVSEYEALALAINQPITNDDHAVCRFPARTLKIIRDKNLSTLPNFSKCNNLSQYLRATNAKSASLVFAGYFIQKPSSAFGHTFLRLHTNQQGDAALLDFAVDFSASVNTSNPIAYGVKGIIGGFPGRFSRMPYFLKLREYADLESRDIWEYPIDLTPQQTQLLVLHLWEMDQTHFDYFYFSENCSYHILRAIEAIASREVVQHLKFFVTPLDTIHALEDASLLLPPIKRPSQFSILNASLKRLKGDSSLQANAFLQDPLSFSGTLPSDAITLDAFMEILNYRFAEQLLTDQTTPEVASLRREVLIARSKAIDSAPIATDPSDRPSLGHRGSWIDISYTFGDSSYLQLTNTFAVHDFRSSPIGFSNRFQMSMGEFSLRISDQKIKVDQIKVFDVLNASSSFAIDFSPAWRFSLGFDRVNSQASLRPYSLISSGLSFDFSNELLLMLAFDLRPRLSEDTKTFHLPLGPSSILVYHFDWLRLGFEANFYREVVDKSNNYLINPFMRVDISKNVEIQVESKFSKHEQLFNLGMTYFY
tara:strand:- start:3713 stop:5494 length:1782 start_codon:yes stop_codon:yes gene_type:complete